MAKTLSGNKIEAFEAWGELCGIGINIYNPDGTLDTWYDIDPEEARKLAGELLNAAGRHEEIDETYKDR